MIIFYFPLEQRFQVHIDRSRNPLDFEYVVLNVPEDSVPSFVHVDGSMTVNFMGFIPDGN